MNSSPVLPKLYGLLITKDDHEAFGDWCRDQLRLYDAVVCLDGSASGETARIARQFSDRLVYLHERDFDIPHKTDHGLRRVVHREIIRRFGADVWIMCCHADEFCYHDPRKIVARADREGYDQVSWFTPHFFPHPDELADWPSRSRLPVPQRFRHYHWNYHGNGFPWLEDRLYRAGNAVDWDEHTHGSVRPHGLRKPAPFHPILCHYKVIVTDPSWYDGNQAGCAIYRHHWAGLENRTGLSYPVACFEDLFVTSVRDYVCCDAYRGHFDHTWNMGDDYRLDAAEPKADTNAQSRDQPADVTDRGNGNKGGGWHNGIALSLHQWVITIATHPFKIRDRVVPVRICTRGVVDDAILHEIWSRDVYGVQRINEPVRCVVDIGAHIGIFARLAHELWPTARLVCCEADPENLVLLERNLNGNSNLEIIRGAITDNDESETTFYAVQDKAMCNSGGGSIDRPEPDSVPTRVPAFSARRLWETKSIGNCDLLKLDCEGSERAILRDLAAAGLLRRVNRIVGEWHAIDPRPETCHQLRTELECILRDTHDVSFAPYTAGREGHFGAVLRG